MANSKNLPIEVRGSARQFLGMSPADFLRDYWQKRPLLIRNAFEHFVPPLQPDDLAGLACEEAALSRLIVHDEKRDRWTVRSSPTEADFAKTPKRDWTLLVQDVDKWDADVARLLEPFSFLPSWRVDDVMVSYAEEGGGVGAHVDNYDVFLLQGLGQRHWAISNDPAAPKDFRHDVELKQLAQFEATHEWLLEPGDMLYLPPGVPHDGVALGNCLTFSIGMRAPSAAELTGDLADFLAERLSDDDRYTDADLAPAKAPGEIDGDALARLRATVPTAAGLDEATLGEWFGRFITRYRAAQTPAPPAREISVAALAKHLGAGKGLLRHPWARLAFIRDGRRAHLFACGQHYTATLAMARTLCASPRIDASALDGADVALLISLLNDGIFALQRGR
jgi:50S ribosomal protein L16 3-hydroxylase